MDTTERVTLRPRHTSILVPEKEKKNIVTPEQMVLLYKKLKDAPDVAKGEAEASAAKKFWGETAEKLNEMGGASKTPIKWAETWSGSKGRVLQRWTQHQENIAAGRKVKKFPKKSALALDALGIHVPPEFIVQSSNPFDVKIQFPKKRSHETATSPQELAASSDDSQSAGSSSLIELPSVNPKTSTGPEVQAQEQTDVQSVGEEYEPGPVKKCKLELISEDTNSMIVRIGKVDFPSASERKILAEMQALSAKQQGQQDILEVLDTRSKSLAEAQLEIKTTLKAVQEKMDWFSNFFQKDDDVYSDDLGDDDVYSDDLGEY